MPSCRITNYTSQPLNVALKHICALHFENAVQPGQTVKLKPGQVWFTLEVLVDDKNNQYSTAQSAAAIAILSIAAIGAAATVGTAALAATGGAAVVATASSSVAAIGGTAMAGFASAVAASGAFLTAHAGTAAKISAVFLPKAIEMVEKEVGGFNAVQKEVISILSSPTVTEDVKKSGMKILSGLATAYAADRAAEAEAEAASQSTSRGELAPPPPYSPEPSTSSKPSFKRAHSSVSSFLSKVSSESRTERKAAKKEAKVAKQVSSWEVVDFNADSEPMMLSTKEQLRIHGLFMSERRHFEVRERAGKLVLMDSNTKEIVSG